MPRLLLVDDESTLLELLTSVISLRLPDMMVDTAKSADAALAHLHQRRYDAIVTDIVLSHANGLALMDRMLDLSPCTPIILMTGLPALITEPYRRRASGILTKPFSPQQFAATVLEAIRPR
jgi:DNA-binding NtrC family response regulator